MNTDYNIDKIKYHLKQFSDKGGDVFLLAELLQTEAKPAIDLILQKNSLHFPDFEKKVIQKFYRDLTSPNGLHFDLSDNRNFFASRDVNNGLKYDLDFIFENTNFPKSVRFLFEQCFSAIEKLYQQVREERYREFSLDEIFTKLRDFVEKNENEAINQEVLPEILEFIKLKVSNAVSLKKIRNIYEVIEKTPNQCLEGIYLYKYQLNKRNGYETGIVMDIEGQLTLLLAGSLFYKNYEKNEMYRISKPQKKYRNNKDKTGWYDYEVEKI